MSRTVLVVLEATAVNFMLDWRSIKIFFDAEAELTRV